jgi:hypothetical protein
MHGGAPGIGAPKVERNGNYLNGARYGRCFVSWAKERRMIADKRTS